MGRGLGSWKVWGGGACMTCPLRRLQCAYALPHRSALQSRRGEWEQTGTAAADGIPFLLHPQITAPARDPRALSGRPHPKSPMQRVREKALEEVVVMNVDSNTLETPFDDVQALPPDVVSVTPFYAPETSRRPRSHMHRLTASPCPTGVPAEAEAEEGCSGAGGRGVASFPQSPGPALRGVP